MEVIYLDPKMDFIFKKLMEDEELLLDFVTRVLSQTEQGIVSVEIVNPETPREHIEDKYSILDVKAITNDGRIINIEIQRRDEFNMVPRSLFHWSEMFSQQLKKGKNYNKLRKTICINILDFNLLDEAHFHNYYTLINPVSHNSLNAPIEIHFVELKKYEKYRELSDDEGLKDWIEFLNAPATVKEKSNPKIQKALDTLEGLSHDGETKELYNLRKEAQENGEILLNTKFSEGVEKGIEQGYLEAAKRMLGSGMSMEMVSEVMGIEAAVLRKL